MVCLVVRIGINIMGEGLERKRVVGVGENIGGRIN